MKQESEDGTKRKETNRTFQSVAISAIVLCFVAIVNHVSGELRTSSDNKGLFCRGIYFLIADYLKIFDQ